MHDHHVLAVADWSIDPHAVIARLVRRPARTSLVVPAWLHGIDWVGDPHASVPCAERQLARLTEIAAGAGVRLHHAAVGDPDPLAAIEDACDAVRPDELLLFVRERRGASVLGFALAARARTATGLPVCRVALPPAAPHRGRFARLHVGAGHCALEGVR
jgi:hypothetical protein